MAAVNLHNRTVILDTETTGLDPRAGHRLVEVAAVVIDAAGHPTEERFHAYLNPDRPVGDSETVHRLSDAFLADKPRYTDIRDDLLAFLAGADLVIHNAEFDIGFLNAEARRCGDATPIEARVGMITDTIDLSRRALPEYRGRRNLDALSDHLGVDRTARAGAHGALVDCIILAGVHRLLRQAMPEQSDPFDSDRPRRPLERWDAAAAAAIPRLAMGVQEAHPETPPSVRQVFRPVMAAPRA